jgi:F0F1-type ATP synthase membrane subunit b/b'
MNIMGLLDYLQDELEKASNMPLSSKALVDREKCLNIVGDIRQNMPREIMEAQTIQSEKNQILYDAEKEAEAIIADAEAKARKLVEQEEITRMAAIRAEEIMTSAHTSAREIKKSANEYVEDILADLENYVSRSLDIIRQNRESMRGR